MTDRPLSEIETVTPPDSRIAWCTSDEEYILVRFEDGTQAYFWGRWLREEWNKRSAELKTLD